MGWRIIFYSVLPSKPTPFRALSLALVVLLGGCGPGPRPLRTTGGTLSLLDAADVKSTPPFTQGARDYEKLKSLPTQEEVDQTDAAQPIEPQLAALAARSLVLTHAKMTIDVDRKTMNLQGQLSLNGKSEAIDLLGDFKESYDAKKPYWASSNMKATDPQVRQQRRIQATALCTRAELCDEVVVEIYYQSGDKLYHRQFNQRMETLLLNGSARPGATTPLPTPASPTTGTSTATPASAAPVSPTPSGASTSAPSGVSTSAPSGASTSAPSGASTSAPSGASTSAPSGRVSLPTDLKKPARIAPAPPARPPSTFEKITAAITGKKPAAGSSSSKPSARPPAVKSPAKTPAVAAAPGKAGKIEPKPTPKEPSKMGGVSDQKKTVPMPEVPDEKTEEKEELVPSISGEYVMPPVTIDNDSIPLLVKQRSEAKSAPSAHDFPETRTQAIASPDRGKLQDPAYLPRAGEGFIRNVRYVEKNGVDLSPSYGTDTVIEFLLQAARTLGAGFPDQPRMIIGQVSSIHGGKIPHSSSVSHQNGLDADVGFFSRRNVHETFWFPYNRRSGAMDPDYDDARNWSLLTLAMRHHRTDLSPTSLENRGSLNGVFVSAEIKHHLCAYTRSQGLQPSDPRSEAKIILDRLVPDAGHANHFHFRFLCPATIGCQEKFLLKDTKPRC